MIHVCLDSSVMVFNNHIQSEVVFSSLSVSLSNLYSADLFTSAWKHIFIINIRIFFALIVAVMDSHSKHKWGRYEMIWSIWSVVENHLNCEMKRTESGVSALDCQTVDAVFLFSVCPAAVLFPLCWRGAGLKLTQEGTSSISWCSKHNNQS